MKQILEGIAFLFTVSSCFYFWYWIIKYEEQSVLYEREIMFNDKEDN